jgi:hypothetical protein
MIMRGGGIAGTGGLDGGADTCTPCRLIPWAVGCVGGAALVGVELAGRGGIATAGGAAVACVPVGTVGAAGGVATTETGTFGGITTTDGGRIAATDAGVTSFGAGASTAGLGAAGLAVRVGASSFASMEGAATGGFATGRVAGRSAASLCWVMARSTSPGREILDRSILVLISSSPWLVGRAAFGAPDPDSRERRCLRTSSASCSSRELECVFFSVTPTTVSTSRISLLLTSSSRARSLIRIFIRSRFPFRPAVRTLRSHI